jgi:hypothetical protein
MGTRTRQNESRGNPAAQRATEDLREAGRRREHASSRSDRCRGNSGADCRAGHFTRANYHRNASSDCDAAWHAWDVAIANCDTDTDCDEHTDCDSDRHGYAHSCGDRDSDSNANADGDTNSNAKANCDTHAGAYGHSYTDADRDEHADGHSASPLNSDSHSHT